MRLQAGRGIDGDGVDLLRAVVGDVLDAHAAFRGGDDGDAAGGAIDQQSEVEFLVDVDAVGHVQALHLLAMLTGLDGDQRVAQHVLRRGADLFLAAGEADTALGIGAQFLELALATAAGVDLRLDDVERSGKLVDGGHRLLDAHRRDAGGDRHAKLRQQFLGLIFVDVHRTAAFDSWVAGVCGRLKHDPAANATLWRPPALSWRWRSPGRRW